MAYVLGILTHCLQWRPFMLLVGNGAKRIMIISDRRCNILLEITARSLVRHHKSPYLARAYATWWRSEVHAACIRATEKAPAASSNIASIKQTVINHLIISHRRRVLASISLIVLPSLFFRLIKTLYNNAVVHQQLQRGGIVG